MKRTLIAVGLTLAATTAFAGEAKHDSLAQTVTSLCVDANVTKADLSKCEKRVQAIVVNAVIAHNSARACANSPEKVQQYGLAEECAGFERDDKIVTDWQESLLAHQQ